MQALPALGQAVSAFTGLFRGGAPTPPATPNATQPTQGAAPAALSDDALLDLIDKRYKYARSAKWPLLENWATCLAFYVGEQWRRWDAQSRRLVVPSKIPTWRILPTYNQLPGVIDTAATSLGGTRQLPQARPDDESNPESRDEASRSTHALQSWWDRAGFDITEHEINVGRILFGSSFAHLYWDAGALAKVPVPDPLTGAVKAKYAPVGDLCGEVLTVFDVFPEPCERWDDASYVIVARRKPLHWFKETFGAKGGQVEADKGDVDSAFNTLIPGLETMQYGESAGAPDDDGMATLKIYYQRPSKSLPQGRTVYVAGKVVLFRQESLPLPFQGCKNPLPVKMIPYRYVPKRMWPKGLIEECLSPQRELNRGLGNLAELLGLYRGPKWFVHKSAKVRPGSITSAPNEVVEWDGTVQPVAVPPPGLPASLAQYHEMQREELRAVAGQHEVSEGQVPTGVTAATAIAYLQQAEAKRTDTPARLGKFAFEDLFKHVLVVLAERYREPRLLSVPGRRGQQQTSTMQGGDLGALEVVVNLTTGTEDNDSIRAQQLNDWIGAGLMQMVGTPIMPVMLNLLRDVGQDWIAETIEQALPEMQAQQQQQMAQQQQMEMQQAAMQGGGPSGPDPQAQMALQAQQQQGQAQQQAQQGWQQLLLQHQKLQAEQAQAEAQREHEIRLAQLQGQQQLAAVKARPKGPAQG